MKTLLDRDVATLMTNAPEGQVIHSLLCGESTIEKITDKELVIKSVNGGQTITLDRYGKLYKDGDLLLFPHGSKNNWAAAGYPSLNECFIYYAVNSEKEELTLVNFAGMTMKYQANDDYSEVNIVENYHIPFENVNRVQLADGSIRDKIVKVIEAKVNSDYNVKTGEWMPRPEYKPTNEDKYVASKAIIGEYVKVRLGAKYGWLQGKVDALDSIGHVIVGGISWPEFSDECCEEGEGSDGEKGNKLNRDIVFKLITKKQYRDEIVNQCNVSEATVYLWGKQKYISKQNCREVVSKMFNCDVAELEKK